ncbi:hypothetical protein M5D96_010724, partial [Drosophila gunungcola]
RFGPEPGSDQNQHIDKPIRNPNRNKVKLKWIRSPDKDSQKQPQKNQKLSIKNTGKIHSCKPKGEKELTYFLTRHQIY